MKKEERINRNIRLNDAEWEAFKTLLGAEWLRAQIARAIKRNDRKPTAKPREKDL